MSEEHIISKLRKKLSDLEDKYDKIEDLHWEENYEVIEKDNVSGTNNFDSKLRYEVLMDQTKSIRNKMSDVRYEIKKLTTDNLQDFDDHGHLMTMGEFKECVESGGFIDYDGFGCYATDKKKTNKIIRPSDFKNNRVLNDKKYTHVVWYNR